MKKIALITGIRGQDGAYLANFLLEKGYKIIGADRRNSEASNWRLKELGIEKSIQFEYLDLLEFSNIYNILKKIRPNEIYNLGAQTYVKSSFDQPLLTSDINALGCLRILESIRLLKLKTKFYQASSSEMFGNNKSKILNELTPFSPESPYAVSKVFAHFITTQYRKSYNIFACSGILFNHESSFRGEEFVTRKIVKNACLLKKNLIKKFELGNIDSKRDWGFAGDYVEAMWHMLQQKKADDYVIATNKVNSVKDCVECVFEELKIPYIWKRSSGSLNLFSNGRCLIRTNNKDELRPTDVVYLKGNFSKAKKAFNWKPKTNFKNLIKRMINEELKRL